MTTIVYGIYDVIKKNLVVDNDFTNILTSKNYRLGRSLKKWNESFAFNNEYSVYWMRLLREDYPKNYNQVWFIQNVYLLFPVDWGGMKLIRMFLNFYVLLLVHFVFLILPGKVLAKDAMYVLSYSPGTLFHQLVRDRAMLVYGKANIPARFVPLPHNRSLLSANEGSVDGDVGRVPSVEEKYPNLMRVKVKLMDLNGVAYTIRDDIHEYSDEILSRYSVGYVLGVRWTEKKMKGKGGSAARDYPALIEMLLQGRVDIILATEASADSVINEMGGRAERIRKIEPYVLSAPIYHYVHKKNEKLIPMLEKAITELREAGKL